MIKRSFIFKPTEIIKARIEIEKKHIIEKGSIESYHKLASEVNFKDLLNKIMKIKNENELEKLAYELNTKELYLLANYCIENKYSVDLSKIFRILDLRYRKNFLKIYYYGFQRHYTNFDFNNYFSKVLRREQSDEYLGFQKGLSAVIASWLGKEDVIREIVKTYYKLNRDFESFVKIFKLNDNSKLVIDCKKHIYIYCDEERYLNTNEQYLLNTIKSFNRNELARFSDNYLRKVRFEKFQYSILNYINYNFDKPNNPYFSIYWKQMSSVAISKFNKWLSLKVMKDFFGESDRFRFWRNYLEILEGWYLVRSKGQLFLDFGNFVVVEFKEIGNAAYIYEKSVFEEKFGRFANESNAVPNSKLKDQFLAIDRITHSGNWEYRAAQIIRSVIENA